MTYQIIAKEILETINKTLSDDILNLQVLEISNLIRNFDHNNKIVCLFGNGGSAADAQHFAAELICTYKSRTRKPYKAIALTTDSSIITAYANDFNYDLIFSRQIEALANLLGMSIGFSTSGKSKNVISALNYSKQIGLKTILFCGDHEIDNTNIDLIIKIPSKNTAIIQTITQMLYHSICQNLEE